VGVSKLVTLASAVLSPASATTVALDGVEGFGGCDEISILSNLRGSTGGTLDVYIQHSPDNVEYFDFLHYAQLAAGAPAALLHLSPPVSSSGIVTIGSGVSPVLAANSFAGGRWAEWLRVVFVAGGAVSGPQAQTIRVLGYRKH
jgi:hypothetical protein